MLSRLPLAIVLLACAAVPAFAQDQEREPGRVAARAFSAAPAPLAFTVEPGENTTENEALAARIAKESAARGLRLERDGAALVLRFDTEVRTAAQASRQSFSRESSGAAESDLDAPAPLGSPDEVTNLLSSRGSGLVGRRSPPEADYARGLRYVINATLDDRASGRRLWQGHVSYDTAAADRTAMFVALAPVLVEQIGRTTQERTFRLD